MYVDLDDAGVRCNLKFEQPRIFRQRIAFDKYRHTKLASAGLDGGEQRQRILQHLQRW